MRKINMSKIKSAMLALVGGSALTGGAAFAQATGNDYSGILSGLSTSTAITAIECWRGVRVDIHSAFLPITASPLHGLIRRHGGRH